MNHESPTTNVEQSVAGVGREALDAEPVLYPRIWVASLTDHEHGIPHGAWISAAQDLHGIRTELDLMLDTSPTARRTGDRVSDWAIFYAADFGAWPVYRHAGLERISQIGRGIAEHGAAFSAWANIVADQEQLIDFNAAYLGHFDSLQAYLEQRINDLAYDQIIDEAVPAQLRPWVKIDLAATAADLLDGGDLHVVPASNDGVWIFNG